MTSLDDFVAAVRADLREAHLRRERLVVSTLREILSVIDNASAVDAPQGHDYTGTAPTEVPRRQVTIEMVTSSLLAHVEERREAAATYRDLDRHDHAEELDQQAAIILRYLRIVDSRGGELLPHDWDASYDSTPPWDIGRPQRPFVELADSGGLRGAVLDLGCGTGEHALLAAERGLGATGVDVAAKAIAQARAKAEERGLEARFLTHDALAIDDLGETFDTILDCGFFHVLSDAERPRLADAMRRTMSTGAPYYLLCFSEKVPGDTGPRRIHQDEIRSTFADGFEVEAIEESFIEATFLDVPVPAWLAHIRRV